MKQYIYSLFIILTFFGIALGMTLIFGDRLFDPIEEMMFSNGIVWKTKMEVLGLRILKGTSLILFWGIVSFGAKEIIKEIMNK